MKKYILFIAICCTLNSCKNEIKPLVFKTESISNRSFQTNSTISFDKVEGNDNIAKKINTTLQGTIASLIPNSEENATIEAAINAFENDYKAFKTDIHSTNQPWELHVETEVVYQSIEVVTIVINVYSDTGGAHGNDTILLLNFNPKNGDLYVLSDMIDGIESFKSIAETYFITSLKNVSESTSISEFFFGKSFQLPENIGFSEDGIVLLYNTYEVSTYNQGFTEFVIPFEDVNSYLKIN